MKQVRYADGSTSREIENEDWEATGQEEMNRLYAEQTQKRSFINALRDEMHVKNTQKKSILDVRDALVNLRDLVEVCGTALIAEEGIRKKTAHVLFFYVDSILEDLEQELAKQ